MEVHPHPFQAVGFKCQPAPLRYGVKVTHKAFNPEDGLARIIDSGDECIVGGKCERVLMTRCPEHNTPIVGAAAQEGVNDSENNNKEDEEKAHNRVGEAGAGEAESGEPSMVYAFIRANKNVEVLTAREDAEVWRCMFKF